MLRSSVIGAASRALPILAAVLIAGCAAEAESGIQDSSVAAGADSAVAPVEGDASADSVSRDSSARGDLSTNDADRGSGGLASLGSRGPSSGARVNRLDSTEVVRALYVNRWAAQSRNRMRSLIAMADTTVVNAFVLDMKDEFGLNYVSEDSTLRRNAGNAGSVPRLRELLDTLRAHDIIPIARIVVFKDSVAARLNPDETIRTPDGSVWRDEKGVAWVNPYSEAIREYNIRVAEELVRLGFEEIQFDYVRFPEPYSRLPKQVFPGSDGASKPDAIADFLRVARGRLNALGVRSTADVFGLVTTVNGALEVGQHWEKLAPVADVLLPMVYPSHYPAGSFGVSRPNAQPYEIVKTAITRARERNEALGLGGERVRPYLQAFSLGQPPYGAKEVADQIRAVQESGFRGWVLWHPGSKYDLFVEALRGD
jgi:hypothetical protein